MKEFIGKSAKILININGSYLFYNSPKVTDITEDHISFIDKFGRLYTHSIKNIVEINAY